MSRLWSRFGVRALAVLLLIVGVVGGIQLGRNREAQQQGMAADAVVRAQQVELQLIRERHGEHVVATAQRRAAERLAAAKAAAAAKAQQDRARKAEAEASRRRARDPEQGADTPPPDFGPVPKSCAAYTGNRAIGCALLLQRGFALNQMPCLDKLWKKESGWNHKARNPSSGAYGIPQALPGGKMVSAGADWRTNPATQIKWGLGYIKGRYGDPCDAWQHLQSKGWY